MFLSAIRPRSVCGRGMSSILPAFQLSPENCMFVLVTLAVIVEKLSIKLTQLSMIGCGIAFYKEPELVPTPVS